MGSRIWRPSAPLRVPDRWLPWLNGVGLLMPLVYIVVKYHRGMASVIRAHDNLDHFAALYDRMSLADVFAAPGATLEFVLGGLPRDMVGSELFVGVLAGSVFPLVWSLVLSELVTRGVAYFGMRRLLRSTDLASERLVYFGIPVLFAILPFHHPVVAAVAGVPLLLSALVGLHRDPGRSDYLILAVFPALSWAGATVPYLAIVAGYAVVVRIARPRLVAVLRGAAVLVGAFVIIEWRLIFSVLSGPESHRIEIASGSGGGPLDLAALSGRVFSLGRTGLELVERHADHATGAIAPLSVLLVAAAVAWIVIRGGGSDGASRVLLMSLIGGGALLLGAALWPDANQHVFSRLVDLPHFQMDRIVWAIPGLSYLALAAASTLLLRSVRLRGVSTVVAVVMLVQGLAAWGQADFADSPRARVTIDQFYAPALFGEVAELVEADGGAADGTTARVVAVGFHPHVAVYNGFDTADGYWYNYPLDYKHRFRRLIAPALADAPDLATYFDGWGSRAYVFQPALGLPDCCADEAHDPYELSVDPSAFEELGIGYVLSNGAVTNSDSLGLRFLGDVAATPTQYHIFVYATS